MRPLTRIGNTVSRYTRSPSAECFVLTLLMSASGTLLPISTVYPALGGNEPSAVAFTATSCAHNVETARVIASKGCRDIPSSISFLSYRFNALYGWKVAALTRNHRIASFNPLEVTSPAILISGSIPTPSGTIRLIWYSPPDPGVRPAYL